MLCKNVLCKCGRRVQAEWDGRANKFLPHRVGKAHPGFQGISRNSRRTTWCPEGGVPVKGN